MKGGAVWGMTIFHACFYYLLFVLPVWISGLKGQIKRL